VPFAPSVRTLCGSQGLAHGHAAADPSHRIGDGFGAFGFGRLHSTANSAIQPTLLIVPVTFMLAILALLLRLGSFVLGKVSSNRGSQPYRARAEDGPRPTVELGTVAARCKPRH
jgi:hypothetical protein